jgi:hypothetical protein
LKQSQSDTLAVTEEYTMRCKQDLLLLGTSVLHNPQKQASKHTPAFSTAAAAAAPAGG